MSKRQDEWERTSQSLPTATDQCQKDKTSGSAQAKVHQQRLTSVKKTRRVEVHKPKSTNSDCPVRKRQDEWERTSQSPPTATDQCRKRQDEWKGTSQSPPTVTDQCQKDKTSGSAQVKVHQQHLTNVKKDKTGGRTQAKVHQQRLTSVKKTRRVEVHKPKSTNSDCPVRKRQDEWERTSQSPPTATDQCRKRQDEWKRTSQSPPTATDQCQKDKTSGRAQAKVHQQ